MNTLHYYIIVNDWRLKMVKASLEEIKEMIEVPTDKWELRSRHNGAVYQVGITFASGKDVGALRRPVTATGGLVESILESDDIVVQLTTSEAVTSVLQIGDYELKMTAQRTPRLLFEGSTDDDFVFLAGDTRLYLKGFVLQQEDVPLYHGVASLDEVAVDQRNVYRLDARVIVPEGMGFDVDTLVNALAGYVLEHGSLDAPSEESAPELNGNPLITRLNIYTGWGDGAYGGSLPRRCGLCYFRTKDRHNPTGDCDMVGKKANKLFGIGEKEFMPTEIDGLQVGNYCSVFADFRAE